MPLLFYYFTFSVSWNMLFYYFPSNSTPGSCLTESCRMIYSTERERGTVETKLIKHHTQSDHSSVLLSHSQRVCVWVCVLASSLLGILPKELWCLPCITTRSNHLYQLSACRHPSFPSLRALAPLNLTSSAVSGNGLSQNPYWDMMNAY